MTGSASYLAPRQVKRPPGRIRIRSVGTTLRSMVVTLQWDLRQATGQPHRGLPALRGRRRNGFTVVELIVAMTILMILTAAAVPIVRVTIQRNKERDLRRALWEMRDAIDRYKDAADRGAFQIKVDSQGYPPDLETLVKGVDMQGKKMKFLRRIPVDPMTGNAEWGLRSMQDDPKTDSYGGQSVFDVYSKSP